MSLNLTDMTPVGWSMGTAVILNYALQYGMDRLRSVVFVDQSPRFFETEEWPYQLGGEFSSGAAQVLAQDMHYDRAGAAKPFIARCFAEAPSQEILDEMYAETTKTPTSAANSVFLDMAYTDLRSALSRVTIPALLLYGSRSKIFPGDLGSWLHGQIPNSKLVMFENSGHCPFWEEPEMFNREVADFVG